MVRTPWQSLHLPGACVAALALLCAACGDRGPSHRSVLAAWDRVLASSGCGQNVGFSDVRVVGVSREGDRADAILHMRGRWVGPRPAGFDLPIPIIAGPCAGFGSTQTGEREVERHLAFRRYDTGWRLDDADLGEEATSDVTTPAPASAPPAPMSADVNVNVPGPERDLSPASPAPMAAPPPEQEPSPAVVEAAYRAWFMADDYCRENVAIDGISVLQYQRWSERSVQARVELRGRWTGGTEWRGRPIPAMRPGPCAWFRPNGLIRMEQWVGLNKPDTAWVLEPPPTR